MEGLGDTCLAKLGASPTLGIADELAMNWRKVFAQNTERSAATTTPVPLRLGQRDSRCGKPLAVHGTYPEP